MAKDKDKIISYERLLSVIRDGFPAAMGGDQLSMDEATALHQLKQFTSIARYGTEGRGVVEARSGFQHAFSDTNAAIDAFYQKPEGKPGKSTFNKPTQALSDLEALLSGDDTKKLIYGDYIRYTNLFADLIGKRAAEAEQKVMAVETADPALLEKLEGINDFYVDALQPRIGVGMPVQDTDLNAKYKEALAEKLTSYVASMDVAHPPFLDNIRRSKDLYAQHYKIEDAVKTSGSAGGADETAETRPDFMQAVHKQVQSYLSKELGKDLLILGFAAKNPAIDESEYLTLCDMAEHISSTYDLVESRAGLALATEKDRLIGVSRRIQEVYQQTVKE